MQLEEFLYSRLTGFAGLSALVSTRVSPMKSVQAAELPCTTFKRVGGGLDYTHDGAEALTESFWQFDGWGSTFSSARDVAAAIVAALAEDVPPSFYCFVDSIHHDYEADTRIYRGCVEARILYREDVE